MGAKLEFEKLLPVVRLGPGQEQQPESGEGCHLRKIYARMQAPPSQD